MRNFAKVASEGKPDRKSGKEFLLKAGTVPEGKGSNVLRGGNTGADSTEPGAELSPNEIGKANGKILKEPLSNKPDLNKPEICSELSSDSHAVRIRLSVEVLIA